MSNLFPITWRDIEFGNADRIEDFFTHLTGVLFGHLTMSQQAFNHKLRTRASYLSAHIHLDPKTARQNYDTDVFSGTKNIIAAWSERIFSEDVLPQLHEGRSFSYEDEGQYLDVVAGDDEWGMRAFYKDVHDITHITEITLTKEAGGNVGIIVSQDVVRKSEIDHPPPHIPEFISRLASTFIVSDASARLFPNLQGVAEKGSVEKLVNLIRDKGRRQPVIVFAPYIVAPDQPGSGKELDLFKQYVLPTARNLAERTAGFTHVVVVGGGQDVLLGQKLGQDYALNPGEMRVYPPGGASPDTALTMWSAPPRMPGKTVYERWAALENRLLRRLAQTSLQNRRPGILSPFLSLQSKLTPPEPADKTVATEKAFEMLVQVTMHIEDLVGQETAGGDFDHYAAAKALKEDLDVLRALKKARHADLEDVINEVEAGAAKTRAQFIGVAYGISKPHAEKYDALNNWIETHYKGKLVLSDGAKAVLLDPKEAKSKDISLIYAAVELLATHYYEMKTEKGEQAKLHMDCFNERLKRLHLENSPSASSKTRAQYREEYTERVDGVPYDMNLHLKRGAGTDPAEMVRIYYTWDAARKRVVVGALAGHKKNTLTN